MEAKYKIGDKVWVGYTQLLAKGLVAEVIVTKFTIYYVVKIAGIVQDVTIKMAKDHVFENYKEASKSIISNKDECLLL